MKHLLVTGGCGFIGSNFVRHWLAHHPQGHVTNIDALTYAGHRDSLIDLENDERYHFVHGDICDQRLVQALLETQSIDAIVNFAAESHVDRSIANPAEFLRTNCNGTHSLLEASRAVWGSNSSHCRFLQVSTDEVYGSLEADEPAFSELSALAANSPYSASKAAADLMVRAYVNTYGFAAITTRCSNNFGPYQFPEKLIPLVIARAQSGEPIPVYGDGHQVRDWLYVEDHCAAIATVLESGVAGEVYNVGGNNQWRNIDIVRLVCERLDTLEPREMCRDTLISHVTDRPGHDRRYAIDSSKLLGLGWRPRHSFSDGIEKTIRWYLANPQWVRAVMDGHQ